jgi:hypothetical protein
MKNFLILLILFISDFNTSYSQHLLGLYTPSDKLRDSYSITVSVNDQDEFVYFYQINDLGKSQDVRIIFDNSQSMESFKNTLMLVDSAFYSSWSEGYTEDATITFVDTLSTTLKGVKCAFRYDYKWYFDSDVTLTYMVKRTWYGVFLIIKTDVLSSDIDSEIFVEGGDLSIDNYDTFTIFTYYSLDYDRAEYHFKNKTLEESYLKK